jgi:histidinol-phosphate aminotransferase
VLGNGSNDVLDLAARAFLTPQDDAVYSQHAFAVYPLAVQAIGARGIEVPARDYGHDVQAMARAVTPKTRLVFIANPNNPTGTMVGAAELEAFIAALPGHVLVVLDEAYNEYLPAEARTDTLPWLARYPNLVITRTFSKVYGLAGLRVGYSFASPVVADLMNRVRPPRRRSKTRRSSRRATQSIAPACASLPKASSASASSTSPRTGTS